MRSRPLPDSWNLNQILDDLNAHGFTIVNHAYSTEYLAQVATECSHHFDEFREAGIQNGVVSTIRSDHILWINESLPIAEQHVETLTSFCQHLNQAFFLGIKEVEAHFACYNAGEFYALHRDNPQQKNDRIISTVYYLHPEWQDDWGGQLRLQDKNDIWHIITPEPNRLVIFQSNLLHEVLVSKQQRLSITAWLRSGNSIWG
ncbi:2OG-Fe(II) oxygenase [Acinetobacter nosocomialis]|uniref:2OG-Fe(II) oxygenase n=1 Tax=Acinetobacter TaxID=469 RepID=UPI000917576C|nr:MULTISPECIES: 2OG-Fe(II) oxygenase [Acinetobacter]SSQ38756.1 proline hydroxylase [Acinetobacter baumannii]MBD8353440.1 2OG-Fe(II) oxygenase [Acinetobacter nosocomialis]MBJ8495711.1 2OG-Fe(II) oxygenase [Acinetobacter nosocomialis]MBZ6531601.1 2OG-Fe(II) oxygenase [Acinetobacter nosocomialis]MDI9745839.1 2OG-Fe(II) oxygenase [Acinetobacter nosocomialis]